MRFFSFALFFLLAVAGPSLADDKKKPTPVPSTAEEREEAIFKDVPVGETFTGLKIPQMTPGGKLLMLFDTQKATRVDDRHITMEVLKIQVHNDDGTTFNVEMPHAIFDLDTRILNSDTPVTIAREDFTITGDSGEFDTRKRFGRVIGNVKMIILNTENIE